MDDGTAIPLPPLDGKTIAFVIVTRAGYLRLRCDESYLVPTLTVTRRNLNFDMEIVVDTLSAPDKVAWTKFCDLLLDGVKIQFLFTTMH